MKNNGTMIPLPRFEALLAKRNELKTRAQSLDQSLQSLREQLAQSLKLTDDALALAEHAGRQADRLLEAREQQIAETREYIAWLREKAAEAERRQELPLCPLCGQHADRLLNS